MKNTRMGVFLGQEKYNDKTDSIGYGWLSA